MMPTMRTGTRVLGFSLLELVIAVAVAGLLAVVALPSFMDQIRKSRRADAHDLASAITQAQERYRMGHSRFASSIEALAGEGISAHSPGGHYQATISDGTGVGYTVTIRALSAAQAADQQCAELKLVMLRGGLTRTAKNSEDADSSAQCWPQ